MVVTKYRCNFICLIGSYYRIVVTENAEVSIRVCFSTKYSSQIQQLRLMMHYWLDFRVCQYFPL